MEHIYTFVGGSPDFVMLSQKEFRRRFGINQAIGFLKQIRGTLTGEARDHRRPGCFYTGLRHAFAEIDGLGKLYKGEYGKSNTAANAIAFGKNYLGRINPRYQAVFALLFDMYRHGLAHGHLTRSVRYRGKDKKWHFIYWMMTEGREDHLCLRKESTGTKSWLIVSVSQLVDDTIAAIDLFIDDLQKKGPSSRLFTRFREGYAGTCIVLREPGKGKKTKLTLNGYSQDGIDWIRENGQ
jgi:hypothetical protein